MNFVTYATRNINFLKELWKNKVAVRALVNSENFIFVRDFHPGHFYSPLPDLPQLRANARSVFDRSISGLPGIALNVNRQMQLLDTFSENYGEIAFPDRSSKGFRYFFDNSFFSYGDGIVLYCFLRQFKPKRVVEIGSGFSSAEMLDVNDRIFDKRIEFTFVEPHPQRLLSLLSGEDMSLLHIVSKPVQQVDPSVFGGLAENDILFIDSSHVAKIQSDVLYVIFNVLPLLKKGVIVHFHDILWPFEYPERWIEDGRAWNEAYFLRAFLQDNPTFEILYFNSYMSLHHSGAVEKKMPAVLRAPSNPETVGNSSLWLRKVV
jgi:hypothetical protein